MSAHPDFSLAKKLTAMVRREASSATLHVDEDRGEYWCISWRLNDNADRELFLESANHLEDIVMRLAPVWRAWNTL